MQQFDVSATAASLGLALYVLACKFARFISHEGSMIDNHRQMASDL